MNDALNNKLHRDTSSSMANNNVLLRRVTSKDDMFDGMFVTTKMFRCNMVISFSSDADSRLIITAGQNLNGRSSHSPFLPTR